MVIPFQIRQFDEHHFLKFSEFLWFTPHQLISNTVSDFPNMVLTENFVILKLLNLE